MKSDIRAEIWTKMINSPTWNPIAVLTLANNGGLGKSAGAVEIARRMMTKAEAVAATFGATLATPWRSVSNSPWASPITRCRC